MKNAVIYARYSSGNQREESIDAQLRICRKYADDNDFIVLEEYTDSALSGRTDQRPAFQKMIEDSNKKRFQTVLVYAHDRFSRNKYDTVVYKRKLAKNNVRVLSVTMPLDDTPESSLMEGIMEGFAQYYSENLSRSTRRGLEENALHCKPNGLPPTGYKIENGQIVLDPIRSQAVKMIFEMYLDGKTKKEICATLNAKGYTTRTGKPFKTSTLYPILTNERYTGCYIFADTRTEGGIPAIVSKEMFEAVQERVEQNRRSKGRNKAMEEYLLSGKVFCGHCGGLIIGECGTSKTGKVYNYYSCTNRKHPKDGKKCTKKNEQKEWLENVVIDYIRDYILTDELIEEIATRAFAVLEDEISDKSMLLSYEQEFNEVSKKINNILKAIENGIFSSSTQERLLELEERQEVLKDNIIREKLKKPEFTKEHIVFWLNRFRENKFDNMDYNKAIVNYLIDRVDVYDGDDNGSHKKIVVSLKLKNTPTSLSVCSDSTKMAAQFEQYPNKIIVDKYFFSFCIFI